jgi:hypothetical protein
MFRRQMLLFPGVLSILMGAPVDRANASPALAGRSPLPDPIQTSTPDWIGEGNQVWAAYGYAVSSAGDVNGDGYGDLIVGAFNYDGVGIVDEGKVFLYLGSPSGLSTTPVWTAEGHQERCEFGVSVASAGDVNGDGYDDIVVGAPFFRNHYDSEGRVYLWLGSATGIPGSVPWILDGGQAGALLGSCVAGAGDVNGDGYGDVILGASLYNGNWRNGGAAYVFLGSPAGLSGAPIWTMLGDQDQCSLGRAVASAGDVNGDGYADILVGADRYNNGFTDGGRAYLYLGSSTGPGRTPVWITDGNQDGAGYASVLAPAGDVNGDGFADILIGAPGFDDPEGDEGTASLFLGSNQRMSTTPAWVGENNSPGAWYGYSLGSAGDVNGDGFADVIIGIPLNTAQLGWEGRAEVYLGSAAGLASDAMWFEDGHQYHATYGGAVAGAGDVNGDGKSDVVVGAPYYDDGQADEGTAYVYLGPDLGGAPSAVEPHSSATASPIELSCPNPFRAGDAIRYRLTVPGARRLRVADVLGRVVAEFPLVAGSATGAVHWDGRDSNGSPVAGGVYWLRLESGGSAVGHRFVLIR